jgi:hypothetical protein
MSRNILFNYRISCTDKVSKVETSVPVDIENFKPKLLRLKLHPDRLLLYIFWFIFTRGKYQIYYVKDKNGTIIHYSHVLPKIFKFPFMKKKDLEIGPCWTHEKFRGKNIYPYVLTFIINDLCIPGRSFYIMTDENNIPSQKGILKAGFRFIAKGNKKGILGIYTYKSIPQ